jgi:adenine phosphoribosyltransferase
MQQASVKERVVRQFAFVHGHSDLWRLFYDGDLFSPIVRELAEPFRAAGVTKIVGIEAKGFILGGAVAVRLGVGFVAIRKPGSLYPGPKISCQTETDYRGNRSTLLLQRAAILYGDRVLLVDDWLETGSQALAAKAMVEELGGSLLGCSIIVDQLPDAVRTQLVHVVSIVAARDLGA